ncbi:MAG TPA: hypothetical protein VJK26_03340 [Patescibacteria group bacterium]|nr:hypothetical protein [Patescibacteria group bacterium]
MAKKSRRTAIVRVVDEEVKKMAERGREWMLGEGLEKTEEIVRLAIIREREILESQQPRWPLGDY